MSARGTLFRFFFFSSRRRHTRYWRDWSSDVCSSDLHSLGIFYTALTQWLGFPKYGDEGKVMGLAPYGDPEAHLTRMRDLVRLDGDLFQLGLDYFTHDKEGVDMTWDEQTPSIGRIFSDRMVEAFGPAREPRTELERRHEDVAAALQATLEDAYLHLVRVLSERTRQPAICLAGG